MRQHIGCYEVEETLHSLFYLYWAFAHDVPDVALHIVCWVHLLHEIHILFYLVVVVTVRVSELIVDDGNVAAVHYYSVRAKHTRHVFVLVDACDGTFVIYGVFGLEPRCDERILETFRNARRDGSPVFSFTDNSFRFGLTEHFFYLTGIVDAAEYFVHAFAYFSLRELDGCCVFLVSFVQLLQVVLRLPGLHEVEHRISCNDSHFNSIFCLVFQAEAVCCFFFFFLCFYEWLSDFVGEVFVVGVVVVGS